MVSKSVKVTKKNFEQFAESVGCSLVDFYKKPDSSIRIQCDNCLELINGTPRGLMSFNHVCPSTKLNLTNKTARNVRFTPRKIKFIQYIAKKENLVFPQINFDQVYSVSHNKTQVHHRFALTYKKKHWDVVSFQYLQDNFKFFKQLKRSLGKKYSLYIDYENSYIKLGVKWQNKSIKELEAYVKARVPAYYRILSLDPGTSNHGFAVLDVIYENKEYSCEVLHSGLIKSTVSDLTDKVSDQVNAYLDELQALVDMYEIDSFCFERYMTRGIKGTTIECVNIMLGSAIAAFKGKLQILPAAQWKNAFNKVHDLDKIYAHYSSDGIPPHVVDSALIGIYCSMQWCGQQPFCNFDIANLNLSI